MNMMIVAVEEILRKKKQRQIFLDVSDVISKFLESAYLIIVFYDLLN